MKQTKTSHQKIAPGIETTKKRSLQISISSLNGQVVLPHPARTMPGNRQNPNNRQIVRSPSFSCMQVPRGSSEHGTPSSNPTASTGVDRYQTGICKTPVFWRPSATRKTTRFSVPDAKYNAARRHAPSCMGATDGQSNWPEMLKTLNSQES